MQSQSLPPMIIFINKDITYPPVTPPGDYIGESPANPQNPASPNVDAALSELTNLQVQLFIDETMSKHEFDARVAGNPDYPTIVHLQRMRILVILHTFQDFVNREQADVVLYLYQGQGDVEFNRFGPPKKSINLQRITIYDLLRASRNNEICLPFGIGSGSCCDDCRSPFYCDRCHTFSGMRICRDCKDGCKCYCNIHAPNCENEYHNPAWIHRK